ncbi:Cyclohexane-1-carbonyl-CoA dehydrogenase [Diplonema papillatum]|nr:Cyclohexane-1-carbonyl-CoA dehydrogenase [Diplonema papillatum]
MSAKTFTEADVAAHNTETDMWLIIDGDVFDITKFVKFHPGGVAALMPFAGKDATDAFYGLHRIEVLKKYDRFRIGKLEGAKDSCLDLYDPTSVGLVPYSEPCSFQGLPSPYYNKSHEAFRLGVAQFREKHLKPIAEMYETAGKVPPQELYETMGKAGILACKLGPGPWLAEVVGQGIKLPGGVKPEEFDYFHELILHDQMIRLSAPGFAAGLGDGYAIGLPPVLHFAKKALRDEVAPQVMMGKKRIALAISEPQAGSDVANIVTTGKKSKDGKFFVVNGTKKWITNGLFADYFATVVRTGGKGMMGVTMLLIERSEGVKTTPISTAYSPSAGTALVEFHNVKVPVENVLGRVNQGFRCVMYNFNHERWMICAQVIAAMRAVQDEAFKWAMQRKAFGKRLIDQPVIRQKMARIVSLTEMNWSWLELITYQMNNLKFDDMMKKLAGPLALLKYQCTRSALQVADDCSQIFGGRAITRTGMGKTAEQFARTVKFGAILGGSEEIMADLGIRMATREFPKHARL